MTRLRSGLVLTGLLLSAAPVSADVHVALANGRVSISATNATTRQILTEWARVGQMRIVNLDRVGGAPTTIEITNATEAEALEILLRAVGGYILAPRRSEMPNASRFDRLMIVPTSSAPASTMARPAVAANPATFPQQVLPPARRLDDDGGDDRAQEPAPPGAQQPQRPSFNVFPQPSRPSPAPTPAQQALPDTMPAPSQGSAGPSGPSTMPATPAGLPMPGMMPPPTQGGAPNGSGSTPR